MYKNKIAPILMMAIVTLAIATFGVMPAIAGGNPGAGCEADTNHYNETMRGDIYFEQQGWMATGTMTKTFNVPAATAGDIKLAKVYTGFWQGSPGKGGHFNISVNGHLTPTYKACDPCPGAPCEAYQSRRCDALNDTVNWDENEHLDRVNMHDSITGCGVHFVSYNATSDIVPGANTITVKIDSNAPCGGFYNIYLIALLVVYGDTNMPEITYWINEGGLYLEKGSACDGQADHLYASKWFNGTHVANPMKVKLWSLGWPHVINTTPAGYTWLNTENPIGVPDISESHGGDYYEVMVRWNNIPTGFLGTPNLLEYYDPSPLYERGYVEVHMVQGPDPNPDLIVTDIDLPPMMQPGTYTIPVTVRNQGGENAGWFYVRLKVWNDGGTHYNEVVNVTRGLTASTSTTVNFEGVVLPGGCYNFTAVADCYNNVIESYENNNESTVLHQVDNVIVVDGNSGFDDLVSMGLATENGGTYYIDGLTISNCAGSGISIKNTDVPFVIKNCVVHSCLDEGMYFENVANGKIEYNEVKYGDRKGIKMVNCNYMEVDHNNLHDNEDYGMDVYMKYMPYVDSHHITITNNEIVNNGLYGIELYCCDCIVHDNHIDGTTGGAGGAGYGIYVGGNDSCIHSNKIENCYNYGMKLDDLQSLPTLRNVVFGNEFVNNNLAFPARTSQAFDSGTTNNWGSTKDLGYYYGGTGSSNAYDNIIGSNWNEYTCGDTDNDGICNNPPYNIDGGTMVDTPTALAWTSYSRILCGDVNCDGYVTAAGDVYPVFDRAVNLVPVCSDWAADVNGDGYVTAAGDVYPVFDRAVNLVPLNCRKGCE